jgi:hypothetical protein
LRCCPERCILKSDLVARIVEQKPHLYNRDAERLVDVFRSPLRAGRLAVVCILLSAGTAIAESPVAPNDIQTTFFNGKPFTATALTGAKFKMTFTPDHKMTRESLGQSGKKNTGTWKLNAKGFCTSWEHAKSNCFTVVPIGENKWSVQKTATTIAVSVAVWSK